MRDPIQAILNAIERDDAGICIVWCPDFGLREWLVDEVEALVDQSARPIRVETVQGALEQPDRLALLVPDDERTSVLELDASRDLLVRKEKPRSQPIVLFLLYDGDGQHALAEASPSLASWIKGTEADPERLAQIDVDEERSIFEQKTGMTVEAWLDAWHKGHLPRIPDNYRLLYRAMLLEGP